MAKKVGVLRKVQVFFSNYGIFRIYVGDSLGGSVPEVRYFIRVEGTQGQMGDCTRSEIFYKG